MHTKKILHYLKLSFIMDMKRAIIYPASFWFSFIIIPFYSLIQIIFIETIYGQTNTFVGYSKYEAYILFGTYRLVQGLGFLTIYNRLADLKNMIRGDGEESFDMVLIKPIDSQVFATLGRYNLGNISSIIVGISIALYGCIKGQISVQPMAILLYLCLIIMGIIVMYVTFLVLNILIFWFDHLEVVEGVWDSYQSFGQYPPNLYHGIAGVVFNIILPITLMAGIPVSVLLGKAPFQTFFWYLLVVFLLGIFSRWFWQVAIKRYSSFSS